MKFNAQTLEELTKSGDYHALPFQMGGDDESRPWWMVMEQSAEQAARLMIWQSAQNIAMLFDVYGPVIEDVAMSINTVQDRDEVYFDITVYINDTRCYPDDLEMDEEAVAQCEQIDERKALDLAVWQLNDIGNQHLLPHIDLMANALGRTFRSSDEARAVAREFAPAVDAWVRNKLLGAEVVPSERRARPASKM